jgi:hypothetical protein
MWYFEKLPKEKLAALQKILAGIKVSKDFKEYQEIPITERLEIMEKVYAALDKKEEWWETFYRIEGYHYGKEGNAEKAAEARRKSLGLIKKELSNEESETPKKLLLYMSAAMKHFLNEDPEALEDLQKALKTPYREKNAGPEKIKDAENGLNERIKDYTDKINSKDQKPRLADK